MPVISMSRRSMCLAVAGLTVSLAAPAVATEPVAVAPEAAVVTTVAIDAAPAKRHPIKPGIYGLGMGSASDVTTVDLGALGSPLMRLGGNSMTTYNWRQNATNLASDWFFESYPYPGTAPGAEADAFVAGATAAGARSMVTVPMIGKVAKLGAGRSVLPSFSIAKYGAQQEHDTWYPDAGNGIRPNGSFVTGNAWTDAYVADTLTSEQAFVRHLTTKFGTAATKGPAYYLLDNEVSLWSSTHRDIRPVGPHATEVRDRMVSHAAAIRAVDPTAKIAGPEEWGWPAILYSGYDQQWAGLHGWSGPFPDHEGAQGGKDYLAWMLAELKKAGRPIDAFTMHYYPQSNEASSDVSTATQLMRNQSTRELWDPNYVSKSWIADKVRLIPRMKALVAANYHADAETGITEYDWGAWEHINGATAQADVLGIFGREGLDLATHWGVPAPETPTYKAFQIYRNYDGNKHTFGDVGIAATAPKPDDVSAFAALRSADKAMTVMIVNKQLPTTTGATTQTALNLAGFTPSGKAIVYQLTATNTITRLANRFFTGTVASVPTPPQSITLVVLPAKGAPVWEPPMAQMKLSAAAFRVVPPVQARLDVDASATTAGSDPIRSYHWDFGDGSTAESVTASHVYARFGLHPVTLTVTDSAGHIARLQKSVSVLPAANGLTSCTATFTRPYDWGIGFTGNIHLTNTGRASVDDWVVEWVFTGGQTITALWGGKLIKSGASPVVMPEAWNGSIAPGASTDIGFNADYTGANPVPKAFLLNGSVCKAG